MTDNIFSYICNVLFRQSCINMDTHPQEDLSVITICSIIALVSRRTSCLQPITHNAWLPWEILLWSSMSYRIKRLAWTCKQFLQTLWLVSWIPTINDKSFVPKLAPSTEGWCITHVMQRKTCSMNETFSIKKGFPNECISVSVINSSKTMELNCPSDLSVLISLSIPKCFEESRAVFWSTMRYYQIMRSGEHSIPCRYHFQKIF